VAPRDPLPSKPWSVYLIRRGDGALYAGIAVDVAARLRRHEAGAGSKALRGRGPLELVFSAPVGDRASAQRIEARLKRLPKAEKERLLVAPWGITKWLERFAAAPALSGSEPRPKPQASRRIVRG
jgi:putative endonuclease